MLAAIRRDDAFEIHESTTERLWTIYPGRRYIRLGLRFRAFAFPCLNEFDRWFCVHLLHPMNVALTEPRFRV